MRKYRYYNTVLRSDVWIEAERAHVSDAGTLTFWTNGCLVAAEPPGTWSALAKDSE